MENSKIFSVSFNPTDDINNLSNFKKFKEEVASFQKEQPRAKTTWLQSSGGPKYPSNRFTQLTVIFEY